MAAKTIVDFANLIKDYTKKLVHWGEQSKGYVGKNKNAMPYYATSGSSHGITKTFNADGTVTINNTTTATDFVEFHQRTLHNNNTDLYLPIGDYVVTIAADKTIDVTKSHFTVNRTYNGADVGFGTSKNIGSEFHFSITADTTCDYKKADGSCLVGFYVYFDSGLAFDNVTIKPMIRDASIPDSTYEPWYMSNRELTENKVEKSAFGQVESGDTASKNYVLGDVFQKNNEFNYTSASISQGASLVSGTNYSHLNMDQMIRDSMHFRRTMTIDRTAKTGTYNPILQNSDCYNSLWMITWGTSNEVSGIGIIALSRVYQHYIAEIVYTSPISCKIDSVTFDGTTITVTMTTDAFWVMNIKALSYGAN